MSAKVLSYPKIVGANVRYDEETDQFVLWLKEEWVEEQKFANEVIGQKTKKGWRKARYGDGWSIVGIEVNID